jgi:hypothetical protein
MTSRALRTVPSILAAGFLATFLTGGISATSAESAPVSHNCGAVIKSFVKTDVAQFKTNSTIAKQVTGAFQTITIPSGTSRCVKVHFSADAACSQTANPDICWIRAATLYTGSFDPATYVNFHNENSYRAANSFEFVKRLEAGTYTIGVEVWVYNSATTFTINNWTMDVEIAK